ncbi:hypothetical protein ACO0RG_004627 [Hanseniaspora osmophila]
MEQDIPKTIIHHSLSKEFNALSYDSTSSSNPLSAQISQQILVVAETLVQNLLYHLDQLSSASPEKMQQMQQNSESDGTEDPMENYKSMIKSVHDQYKSYCEREQTQNQISLESKFKNWKNSYKRQQLPATTTNSDNIFNFGSDGKHENIDMLASMQKALQQQEEEEEEEPGTRQNAPRSISTEQAQTLAYLEMLPLILKDPRSVLPPKIVKTLRHQTDRRYTNEKNLDDDDDDDDDEGDDFEVAGGQISLECPITGSLFVKPLVSVHCGHTFDEHGLREYYYGSHAGAMSQRQSESLTKECPQEACFAKLRMNEFVEDKIMSIRVNLAKYMDNMEKIKRMNQLDQKDIIL